LKAKPGYEPDLKEFWPAKESEREFFVDNLLVNEARLRQVPPPPPTAACAADVSLSGEGKTTPESKKGSPKVNVPSRQWLSQVKTVS